MRILSKLVLVIIMFLSLTACNEAIKTETLELQSSTQEQAKDPLSELLATSSKPAIIKFQAQWCSTCKSYAPSFEELKSEYSDRVDFYDIDVDDSSYKDLMRQFKISRIPDTLFISSDRKTLSRKLGAIPKTKLGAMIEDLLGN